LRAFFYIIGLTILCITFQFADKAGVNKGVIASIFTSAIIFTAIIFRFLYGERISFKQAISMSVIIVGVICIGVGKPN
jgi:drug/metabolite transporter (DMT)-like permease